MNRRRLCAAKHARLGLNQWAERTAAEHDAIIRMLIEKILADEEAHLAWLEQEWNLPEKSGEPLYLSKRMPSIVLTLF
ncbi:hypothetical protein LVJ83_06145 [Uruburuella testudinis]|uniref:Ubiquinone biosynthesis protein COQ7 n=1 Tax=Uruburuella testudinis TaxID=1282863 RepID=A0ABY4DX24_9NEIS|nr:hypothetical protein [Uruburuella testudinis]UOO83038.1 hypothetical protein LVJ83_06145 [Uruburuella testudinis]